MKTRVITAKHLQYFQDYLVSEEKSTATVEKYLRDAWAFSAFTSGSNVTKELTVAYKQHLLESGYAVRSVNSMLASINSLLRFFGWEDCQVKSVRQQKQTYCPEEKELSKEEYFRLLAAAGKRTQINLILQTICSTGIRVSELCYFTVESVQTGEVRILCKGKDRRILVPSKLRSALLTYAKKEKIRSGVIFLHRNGKPLNRGSIWAKMKALCQKAGVESGKVFPHNLRKLFARTFYSMEKDIAKLADILGHSSIDTTRIYIMTTGAEHRRKLERLGLVI